LITFDARKIANLDRVYSSPQIVAQRVQLRAAIAARAGERGLDVGCGAGHMVCELAAEVGPSGRVTGIDASDDAVAACAARVAREGLAHIVDIRRCDAAALEFPDASFDFVTGAQSYCYVADVGAAVREAARVLRRGGRLHVLDTDWDGCVWKSADDARMRRLLDARSSAQFAHARLPRELHAHILAAGLRLDAVTAVPIIETRFDADSWVAGLIDTVRAGARKGGVDAAEIKAWEEDMRARGGEGAWFFCLNRLVFSATKR
jgi:ubiquinone/menaquinone biosynthesis C-methylase UbiE